VHAWRGGVARLLERFCSDLKELRACRKSGLHAAGKSARGNLEFCQRHGIWDATFHNKAKRTGMTASEVRRLKESKAENAKLERMPRNRGMPAPHLVTV